MPVSLLTLHPPYPPTMPKVEALYRDNTESLGKWKREKIGERTLNSTRSFKKYQVRQRKGRSGRKGKLTKSQNHKCRFLNRFRRKIKSAPPKLKPTIAGSVMIASKPM